MYFDIRLWKFTEGVRWRIFITVVIGILAALVGVARLAALGWLLAQILNETPFEALLQSFGIVAFLMCFRGFLDYWRDILAHSTSAEAQMVLRKTLYDKIIELGPAHFGLHRTGDVLLSVVDGVEQLEVYFGQYIPQLLIAFFVPIIIFISILFLDVPVAAVMLAFALFTLFAPSLFHSWVSEMSRARQKAYAEFGAEFLDTLQGLSTLQAFGQSKNRGQLIAEKAHDLFKRTMWVLHTNSLTRGITDTGVAVGAASMLALGASRVTSGLMSLEELLMLLMVGIEFFRPLRELRVLLHKGMMGQSAAQGILKILDQKPVVAPESEIAPKKHQGHLESTIRFDSVEFTYPGSSEPTHQGISFDVQAGERIGIVGSSGCGKSTIVKLLLRLYDPQNGSVLIGGIDLRDISKDMLYQNISVVQQDTYLFHGTVAENLRFGKSDATDAELAKATRVANADEFINCLPNGYNSVIGERGIKLSGGQRQRIAIARAVLRDAPILILDEALSAVDTENEAVIQGALDRVMKGRTTLVFAHRLSSVIDSDRILVLGQGKVVEQGTHSELMQKHGIYHALMAGQIERVDEGFIHTDTAEEVMTLNQQVRDDHSSRSGSVELCSNEEGYSKSSDAILKAEGMGWKATFKYLFGMIMPWKYRLILAFALGFFRIFALIGIGIFSGLIVAAVKDGTSYESLLIGLFMVAPLAGILHWLESWIVHDMAFRLLSELRIALFNKFDALGPAYLSRRRSGDLVAMATHDVELVEYFFAHTVAPTFVAIIVPAIVTLALIFYGPLLALALAPFLLIVGVSPLVLRKRLDHLGSRAREALANLNAHVVDTIQGLVEIIAFQQNEKRGQELIEKTKLHHKIRLPFFQDLTMQTAVLEVATGIGGLVVTITGSYLVSVGSLDSSVLPVLTLLAMSAFLPISEIAHTGRQLADTLGAARRIAGVQNEEILIKDGQGIVDSDAHKKSSQANDLEMKNVKFSYGDEYFSGSRYALQDVSFTVPKGKVVALVGPSGAGKSTVAHLLKRFWDPQKGLVCLLGDPIKKFCLDDIWKNVALVTQDTYLFNTTLRENISFARPSASEQEIEGAIRRAALSDFVASLPAGLDTPVGERGVRLSGGQRQRIAIARSFLKDAPMLILDEATSHLDVVNEKLVHGALEDLMYDRTTVVIAHRLSTIRNASTIIVMERGQIVEAGSHDELIAKCGLYNQLVGRQVSNLAHPCT